jgi:hypothetical protein
MRSIVATKLREAGMFHGLANHTYGATAGFAFVVAGVSGALIVYAVFTFLDILAAPPTIDFLRAAF